MFRNPVDAMRMEQGKLVNNLKSKMWIERYGPAGEFKFVADASSGLKEQLPKGSFVSHVDTTEIMRVEDHEINDVKGGNSEISITGRGLEILFETRIIGSNKAYPTSGDPNEYVLSAGYLGDQIRDLILNHILPANVIDPDDALSHIQVENLIPAGGESISRSLKRGTLYDGMVELLGVQGLGVKVVRPGLWSPGGPDGTDTYIFIHQGVDRTGSIIISADAGEIDSANYIWSIRPEMNAAMIVGRWVETRVVGPEVGVDRRWMLVDASDIDQNYTVAPTGTDLDNVVAAMQQRGLQALAIQKNIALTTAEVSKNANKSTYRKDFDVGDYITVNGSYNESSIFQISEYVEIEDETGGTSYPTLEVI
jgi:hypothetical protein